jgi:hypothetical protein
VSPVLCGHDLEHEREHAEAGDEANGHGDQEGADFMNLSCARKVYGQMFSSKTAVKISSQKLKTKIHLTIMVQNVDSNGTKRL